MVSVYVRFFCKILTDVGISIYPTRLFSFKSLILPVALLKNLISFLLLPIWLTIQRKRAPKISDSRLV